MLCIMGGMESIMSVSLALIGFIYFYTLRLDDIPKGRRWLLALIPILIIAMIGEYVFRQYFV